MSFTHGNDDDGVPAAPHPSSSDPVEQEQPPYQEGEQSTSSSSSDSGSELQEPARKKRKINTQVSVDSRIDVLQNQVSFLTNFLMHQQYVSNPNAYENNITVPNDAANNEFLTNPSLQCPQTLDLGLCETDFDERNVLKPANEKLLLQLIKLQQFNTDTWQHIRYKKALIDMLASPGFCKLKINNELCSLNTGKDFLASTEEIMAATTHALLQQRELLQLGLQTIINWAHSNPHELKSDTLFEKISETFGNTSPSFKLSEKTLQIVCGRRAECVEIRRKRLISAITNKNIQTAINNIPPSEEFLFDKIKLASLIHSLGGPHFWLEPQVNKNREHRNKYKEPIPSTSKFKSQTQNKSNFRNTYNKNQGKQTYKGKSDNLKPSKNFSFRNKDGKKNDYSTHFRGGCLRLFEHRWRAMSANKFIISAISGFRIPFYQKSPLLMPIKRVMVKYATKSSPAMSQILQELLGQKILQPVSNITPSFISKLFLRKKSDGTMRPIFDLRDLNKFVKPKPFRLISHASIPDFLQQGDWMIKIDISQAYFHLAAAEGHRPFLRVSYEEQLYEMTCLPFGLSSAPHLFSAVTCWVAETLRAQGCRVLVYLDDFLLANQNQTKLCHQAAEAVRHLEYLGWQINYTKSILTPTKDLEYLGIRWKTAKNIMSLPMKRRLHLNETLDRLLKKCQINLRELQSLLGQLNFANFVIPRGRLHCRRMQIFLRKFDARWPRQMQLVPQVVYQEMMWWRGATHHKVPIHEEPATHFLATDASDTGWGAHLDGNLVSGTWSPTQRRWHSNKKELYAAIAAIKRNVKILQKSHVLIQSDNRTLIAYIRKEGGTKSLSLLALTFQLLQIIDKHQITLTAYYVPGRYNIIADRLSRGKQPAEWHLLPQGTAEVFRRWGRPEIDLFASRNSAVVQTYVSIDCRDHLAVYTDAFSRTWNYQLAWVFPPPTLLPRVLAHLNNASGTYLVVAPEWPRAFWLQDLKIRALEQPYQLQNLSGTLIDIVTSHPPLQVHALTLKV